MINFSKSKEYFKDNLFENNFFYMPASFNANSYNWDAFGHDFFSIEPALGTVRLYRGGRIERKAYQQAMAQDNENSYKFDRAVFNQILSDGGSMVVNRFDKSSKYVSDLCRELSGFSGHATVGNAYVTQGGSGTFGKHYDAHCVFAVQLIGAKKWTVFRPTVDLPLSVLHGFERPAPSESEMVFDGVINAGDVLYIPRGWWHEVQPITGQPSLHISVGIHTPKIIDYLKWVLANKMLDHIDFRKSMSRANFDTSDLSRTGQLVIEKSMDFTTFEEYLKAVNTAMSDKTYVDFKTLFE